MHPGFYGADLRSGDAGDLFEGKILDKVKQQHGTLGQRKLVKQVHKDLLLFLFDEQIQRSIRVVDGIIDLFFKRRFFFASLAPSLNALLVGNAEKP